MHITSIVNTTVKLLFVGTTMCSPDLSPFVYFLSSYCTGGRPDTERRDCTVQISSRKLRAQNTDLS